MTDVTRALVPSKPEIDTMQHLPPLSVFNFFLGMAK